jgi:hypothetical protein
VAGSGLGVHHRLRAVIDDMDMNALFDQEAKLFIKSWLQLYHIDKVNRALRYFEWVTGFQPCFILV